MKHIDKSLDETEGERLVNRIDSLLTIRNEKRQKLCDEVGISLQAITNWKKQNSLPSVDSAIKIANYLEVSVDWLITGKLTFSGDYDSRPSCIYNRISNLLECEHHRPADTMSLEQLHKPISHIVSHTLLLNWRDDRIVPEPQKLIDIAKYFRQSYVFLVTGETGSMYTMKEVNGEEIDKSEYDLFRQYKKNKEIIWSYDAMYEPDKKYIAQLIKRLFRLRRFSENRDFDLDYNREHPLEEPRQKDPNISDEEYAEMKKKDSHF